MLSFANAGMRQEEASILEFAPSAVVNIRVRKNYAIQNPSVLVFSLASPDLLDTTGDLEVAAAENEWPRLKYMEIVLEQALIKFMGLVEAGAETPWEEAASLLRKHLEPDVFEENAGSWASQSWYCFVDAVIDHSVEGTMGKHRGHVDRLRPPNNLRCRLRDLDSQACGGSSAASGIYYATFGKEVACPGWCGGIERHCIEDS